MTERTVSDHSTAAWHVREPRVADAPSIAALHIETWRETYVHLLPSGFFGDDHRRMRHDMWTGILGAPRSDLRIRVAEADGELVGFSMSGRSLVAEGETAPRERQLFCLYALRSTHGSGIGQALFDAVVGDESTMLWVAKENPRAIAFYRRNGYRFDGVEQRDPGAPLITDARMVR